MKQNLKKQIINSKKDRKKTKLVALRMPGELHEKLEKLASQTDETLTSVILFLIEKGMGET